MKTHLGAPGLFTAPQQPMLLLKFSCLTIHKNFKKPQQNPRDTQRALTLLLQAGHDLDISEVLQFVAHGDGVVRGAQLAVHRGLGAQG